MSEICYIKVTGKKIKVILNQCRIQTICENFTL